MGESRQWPGPRIDPVLDAGITIDEIHALIHRGAFFTAGLTDAALAAAAELELLLQTPADSIIHARFLGVAGGDARVQLFEGTTFSAAGAAVTPVNRNRLSSNASSITLTSAPTLTADGTPLFDGYIPGGTAGSTPGGQLRSFEEFILKANTAYLARLTNASAVAEIATLVLDFYDTEFLTS